MAAKRRRYSEDALGPTVERLMAEAGLTYRSLAERSGLSAGYLNHVVHGSRPVPATDVLERLAVALGVPPEHFLEVRIRQITARLEAMPERVDRLWRALHDGDGA